MYRKPYRTQKARHKAADGHVERSPKPHNPHVREPAPDISLHPEPRGNVIPPDFGDRMGHRSVKRLSGITVERTRLNANKMACYFTKFITNIRGQVRIPKVINPTRGSKRVILEGDQSMSLRGLDVGQLPED